jgi:hypothetical protein
MALSGAERKRRYRVRHGDALRERHAAYQRQRRAEMPVDERKAMVARCNYGARHVLREPKSVAERSAALRWDGLYGAREDARRAEVVADAWDELLRNLSECWFDGGGWRTED